MVTCSLIPLTPALGDVCGSESSHAPSSTSGHRRLLGRPFGSTGAAIAGSACRGDSAPLAQAGVLRRGGLALHSERTVGSAAVDPSSPLVVPLPWPHPGHHLQPVQREPLPGEKENARKPVEGCGYE